MPNSFKKDINSQIDKDKQNYEEKTRFHWSPCLINIFSWIILIVLSVAFLSSIVYNVPNVSLFNINVPIWVIVLFLMILPSFISLYNLSAPFTPDVGLITLIILLTVVGWAMRGIGKLLVL